MRAYINIEKWKMWTHRGKTGGEANLPAWQVPTPRRSVLKESAPLEDPDEDFRYT